MKFWWNMSSESTVDSYASDTVESSPYDSIYAEDNTQKNGEVDQRPSETENESSIYETNNFADVTDSEVSLVGLKYDNYTYLSDEKKVIRRIRSQLFTELLNNSWKLFLSVKSCAALATILNTFQQRSSTSLAWKLSCWILALTT